MLNPNRPDCNYPEKNLCGVGVAFKLVQALLGTLHWPPDKLRRVLESFLKLVAIGTVADVVPLTGENRIIVRHGLIGLRDVRNPGLRALLEVAGFSVGSVPSAAQVAFRIAPRMNAAGRMATANDVIEMLLTGDTERAQVLAAQLHALNTERQKTEADISEAILVECARAPVTDAQAALRFLRPQLASRSVGHRGQPVSRAFSPPRVCAQRRSRGRSRARLRAQHYAVSSAGGPGIDARALREVRRALARRGINAGRDGRGSFPPPIAGLCRRPADSEDFVSELEIDAVIAFGRNPRKNRGRTLLACAVRLRRRDPRIRRARRGSGGAAVIWKEKHLRVPLRQDKRILWLKAWNFAERAAEFVPGARVDAAVVLEEDSYSAANGLPGWSAILRDVRPAGAAR